MAAETTLYKDQGEELSGDAQGGQRNLYLGKSGVDGNEIRKIIRKNKIPIHINCLAQQGAGKQLCPSLAPQ